MRGDSKLLDGVLATLPAQVAVAGFLLVYLGGCQHTAYHPPTNSSLIATDDVSPKQLTPAQLADLQIALGRTMEKQGQAAQALAAYQEALKQDPKRPDAHVRLAIVLDQQGKFPAAQEHYKKAIALQPGSADIYCNMGYSFYLQQRWAEAEMNLRQALALEPGHRRSHNNLGLVLAQLGKRDDALTEFRKGGCKEGEAHANLAFVLALKRDLPDASTEYEHALSVDPSLQVAHKGLEEVKVLQARFVTSEK